MRVGIDASRAFVKKPTGTERYAFEVINRILKLPEAKKHEWILYTRGAIQTSFPTSLPKFSLGRGFAVAEGTIKIVNIPFPYLWTQAGLAARTWVDRLDVLWVPAHTLPVLRKPGVKTVVTIHGIEYEWLPAYENLLQRWYLPLSTEYAVATDDKVIAVSGFTKRQLIERLGADERKIKVIYEGYSSKPGVTSYKSQILNKYKLIPQEYLLFVGTVQPRKNLERLIEAFFHLGGNLMLVICGKLGWGYEKVAGMVQNSGGKVVLTEYVSDEEREILLKNCLAYVQSSITEGFGLPVLEAMAVGVPVASSEGGALKEVIGNAGLLFNPYEVKDITEKLELLVSDEKLRKELRAGGLKRVGDFSWDKAAQETCSMLLS
jgi:glycosyltransferase involved in cell wall biosynthesis